MYSQAASQLPQTPVLGVPASPRAGLTPLAVAHPPQVAQLSPGLEASRDIDPRMLCCALTGRLMREPVLADDGYTYERDIMQNWIMADNHNSPITEQPLLCDTLVDNNNIKMAIVALTRWRQAGAPDDVRTWLLPAIIDPSGSHNPMYQPMTLSDSTTCDASNLEAMFQNNNVRSPYTQKLWTQHFEDARYNRALQALSAAIIGFDLPAFPTRRRYATWNEPILSVPPPSSRKAYNSFLCGYSGITAGCFVVPFFAAFAVCVPTIILSGLHAAHGVGIGAGTCFACCGAMRAIDYPYYLKANEEAAALYEDKLEKSYMTYNAQREVIGLPPITQGIQR